MVLAYRMVRLLKNPSTDNGPIPGATGTTITPPPCLICLLLLVKVVK